jgi:Domain of unknown function (DUF1963)
LTGKSPTLLLSRRPRQTGVEWFCARSWLGGAPRLGAMPWPRDKSAELPHLTAQIDLAEFAHATGGVPLPAKGLLQCGSEEMLRDDSVRLAAKANAVCVDVTFEECMTNCRRPAAARE